MTDIIQNPKTLIKAPAIDSIANVTESSGYNDYDDDSDYDNSGYDNSEYGTWITSGNCTQY